MVIALALTLRLRSDAEIEQPRLRLSREGEFGGSVRLFGLDEGIDQFEAELFFLVIHDQRDLARMDVGIRAGWGTVLLAGDLVEVETVERIPFPLLDEDFLVLGISTGRYPGLAAIEDRV